MANHFTFATNDQGAVSCRIVPGHDTFQVIGDPPAHWRFKTNAEGGVTIDTRVPAASAQGKVNVGGVQSWSVGSTYPYHAVVQGSGPGVVYHEGPSGKLTEFPFTAYGKLNPATKRVEGGDFQQACRLSETEAKLQLILDRQVPRPFDGDTTVCDDVTLADVG